MKRPEFFAIDNRCPHMGFPLHRGDVHGGLLDCRWHHARFDSTCGGTLDPWADDVDRYRVVVEDGNVYVDPERPPRDPRAHGLEQGRVPLEVALTAGAHFGGTQNNRGWSSGLTILIFAARRRGGLNVKSASRSKRPRGHRARRSRPTRHQQRDHS